MGYTYQHSDGYFYQECSDCKGSMRLLGHQDHYSDASAAYDAEVARAEEDEEACKTAFTDFCQDQHPVNMTPKEVFQWGFAYGLSRKRRNDGT